MLYPTGAQIPFAGQYTSSGAGKTGLTPTISIVRVNSDGTRTVVISAASATAAAETDATNLPGLYHYLLAGASTGTAGLYLANFHTTGTVDQKDGAALEIVGAAWVAHVDADISSRSTYAGGAVASVIAPVTVGTNNDKTGYSLTVAPGDATAANQAIIYSAITALPAPDNTGIAAIKARTDLLPDDPASNTEVDTRLAAVGYTAPDNAGIAALGVTTAAIQAQTDLLPVDPASKSAVEAAVAGIPAAPTSANIATAVWNALVSSPWTLGSWGAYLLTKLGQIGQALAVTITAPVLAGGVVNLVVGADYQLDTDIGEDGRLLFTIVRPNGLDLTDATFEWRLRAKYTEALSQPGVAEMVSQTDTEAVIALTLTKEETAALTVGVHAYDYRLWATLPNEHVIPLTNYLPVNVTAKP